MRRWLKFLGIAASACTAVSLANVVPVSAGPNGTGGGPTAEDIIGSGSDTTQILMLHLDGLYNISEGCAKFLGSTKPLDFSCVLTGSPPTDPPGTILSENYEHDRIREADFLGSSTGISQLCTQGLTGTAYIDFARSSRGPKTGQTSGNDCAGLHFVAYARDGITVESHDDGTTASGIHGQVNPDPLCPATPPAGTGFCVTQTQLQNIYVNCSFTNWSSVGGQSQTIQIYTPQSGSGTRSQFETFLGNGTAVDSSTCIPAADKAAHQVPENQNTGILAADTNTFIFPFSFAIYHTEVNDAGGFRIAAIDGVAPNETTIGCVGGVGGCTAFPYSRYVYNVFCASTAAGTCGASPGHLATQKTIDYLGEEGWICKPGSNENASWSGAGTPAVDPNMALPHTTSPHFQNNWASIISHKIVTRGFAPLVITTIGGGDLAQDHCRLSTT